MVCDEAEIESSLSYAQGGTIRWMSPELLDPERFGFEDSRPRMESDCYALGMVIYEVLSGQKPFARCREPAVIRKVINGERPERPQGVWFVDDVWEMVERCWESQPELRPDVKHILQCLEWVPERLQPPSPHTRDGGETDTTDSDDWSCYFTAIDISGTFSHFTRTLWLTARQPQDFSGVVLTTRISCTLGSQRRYTDEQWGISRRMERTAVRGQVLDSSA